MTLQEKQSLFLMNSIKLMTYALDLGYQLTYGETFRPQILQEIYYKEGKTKTLNSLHTKRLALDLNLFSNGQYLTDSQDYEELGLYWEHLHIQNRWGGHFSTIKDGNHFEMVD